MIGIRVSDHEGETTLVTTMDENGSESTGDVSPVAFCRAAPSLEGRA
jgi:hypothetical protein